MLTDGATISAKSSGTGEAGSLVIRADEVFRVRDSVVTTEAVQADGEHPVTGRTRLNLTFRRAL